MNEETNLPDGLQLAVDVLLEESARNELIGAPKSWNAELGGAIDAIRAKHGQRLTLQHHACDQVQRIADLETTLDTVCRLRDAAADERDALREQINACTPHLRERLDGGREPPADMLAMREREVLGLLGRLRGAQMQGDALRARLAEIEAQEPVCWAVIDPMGGSSVEYTAAWREACHEHIGNMIAEADMPEAANFLVRPLYARPVPAQAVPDGWRLVPVEPTREMATAGRYRYCDEFVMDYKLMIAAAPEHKA